MIAVPCLKQERLRERVDPTWEDMPRPCLQAPNFATTVQAVVCQSQFERVGSSSVIRSHYRQQIIIAPEATCPDDQVQDRYVPSYAVCDSHSMCALPAEVRVKPGLSPRDDHKGVSCSVPRKWEPANPSMGIRFLGIANAHTYPRC